MAEYIRLSEGLNRYKLVPTNENIWDHISTNEKDYYTSIYRYNEEHYNSWKTTGTVAGITNVKTNKLVFDFDDAENIENARQDAITLVSRLLSKGITSDTIQIAFSGNKGFCVEVDTTERFSPEEFKTVTFALASDLATFDTVVNDAQRILRVVGTRHPKSKLYKFPLSVTQLSEFEIPKIKELAADIDNIDQEIMSSWTEVELPISIKEMSIVKPVEKKTPMEKMQHDLNMDLKPKWITEAKFALQQGFFEEGERNLACMILTSTYKNQGFPKEIVYRMIKGTLELRANRLGLDGYDKDELWKTVIEPVFSPTWKGGTYSYENTPLLQTITERLGLRPPTDETKRSVIISAVGDKFINFAQNFDKNRIKTGIDSIDEDIIFTTGMAAGLLGAPSSGKTSIALNMLEYSSKNGIHCGMGSHDMYDSLLFIRLLQKECPYDFKTITRMVQTGQMDKTLKDAWARVLENFKNVGFNFQSGPSVDDIANFVDEYEQEKGEKMKFLILDYLEKIAGPYSDATANSGYIAGRLADLAKDKNLCLLLLLQPQKQAGDPSDALLSMRNVKGSSRVEQDLRLIMTTWRPGFNPENNNADDHYSCIAVVKNNMGPVGKYNFKWQGLAGKLEELDELEKAEMEKVIKSQERRKAAKSDGI